MNTVLQVHRRRSNGEGDGSHLLDAQCVGHLVQTPRIASRRPTAKLTRSAGYTIINPCRGVVQYD